MRLWSASFRRGRPRLDGRGQAALACRPKTPLPAVRGWPQQRRGATSISGLRACNVCGVSQERGCHFPGDGGVRASVSVLQQRVVRERTPGPDFPQTSAGGLSRWSCWSSNQQTLLSVCEVGILGGAHDGCGTLYDEGHAELRGVRRTPRQGASRKQSFAPADVVGERAIIGVSLKGGKRAGPSWIILFSNSLRFHLIFLIVTIQDHRTDTGVSPRAWPR